MKKLVMVETISQHVIKYCIEVEDDIDHVLDEVAISISGGLEIQEFSQRHIGETIISHREISLDEFVKQFDIDNDYIKDWELHQKLQCVNKINYDK